MTPLFSIIRGISDSINNLITVYTSNAPGQIECENAIRNIQASKHILDNTKQAISKLSYHQCVDTIAKQSKGLGDGMGKIGATVKSPDRDEFAQASKHVTDINRSSWAICLLN